MKIAGFGTDIAQWFGLGPEMVFIDPKNRYADQSVVSGSYKGLYFLYE